MPNKALLAIGTAAAVMALLAWPAPREGKPRDAIQVVHGGGAPSPVDVRIKPGVAVTSARRSTSSDAAGPARYAWEVRMAAADDPPGEPGIWATPAAFAPPE